MFGVPKGTVGFGKRLQMRGRRGSRQDRPKRSRKHELIASRGSKKSSVQWPGVKYCGLVD